jgi:hypothetical protein
MHTDVGADYAGDVTVPQTARGDRNHEEAVTAVDPPHDGRQLGLGDDGGCLDIRGDQAKSVRSGFVCQRLEQLLFGMPVIEIAQVLPRRNADVVLRLDQQARIVYPCAAIAKK